MSKIDFNPVTFSSKLTELNAALTKRDIWVNDNLEVVKKDNGFLRFLKVIVLPLARLFGKDPFSHVRANGVALVIFAEFQKHESELSEEDKKTTYKILSQLNERTKNKYDIIIGVLIPSVDKTFEGEAKPTVADYIDLGVKGTQQVGSNAPPPPPQPSFDRKKTADKQPDQKEQDRTEKSFFTTALKDKALKPSVVSHLAKFDNPFLIGSAPLALHRLKSDVEEFIEALEDDPDFADDELLDYLDLQDSDINDHPILEEYYVKYLDLSEEERKVWAKKTIDHLNDHTLVALQNANKNIQGNKKENAKINHQHEVEQAQAQKQKELEALLAKREEFRKQVEIKKPTDGKNKFSWNVLLNKHKPIHEKPENKFKFTSRDFFAEHQRVVKWVETGDLENMDMIGRHKLLSEIISEWNGPSYE